MKVKTSRREFIKALGVAGVATMVNTSASIAQPVSARPKKKPNLLFIWTDEQQTDTMAAYGNVKIHAPNWHLKTNCGGRRRSILGRLYHPTAGSSA